MATTFLQRLLLKLDGDSSGAQKALRDVDLSLSGIAATIAKFGVAGAGLAIGAKGLDAVLNAAKGAAQALPNLVNEVAATGDHFATLSAQTGIAVESISQLEFVASQAGTSLETITSNIFRFSRTLGSAGPQAEAAFTKLGLSISDLKAKKPEDAFTATIDALGKLPTQTERASAGFAIFGRNFQSIAQLTRENMRGLMSEADRLGLTMTEEAAKMGDAFNDAKDKLGRVFEGLKRTFGVALLPGVTAAVNGVTEIMLKFSDKLRGRAAEWGEMAKQAGALVVKAASALADIALPIITTVLDVLGTGLKTLIGLFGGLAKAVELGASAIQKAWSWLPGWATSTIKELTSFLAIIVLVQKAMSAIVKTELFGLLVKLPKVIAETAAMWQRFGPMVTLQLLGWLEPLRKFISLLFEAKGWLGGLSLAGASAGFAVAALGVKLGTGGESMKTFQRRIADTLDPAGKLKRELESIREELGYLSSAAKDVDLKPEGGFDSLIGLAKAIKTNTVDTWALVDASIAEREQLEKLSKEAEKYGRSGTKAIEFWIHLAATNKELWEIEKKRLDFGPTLLAYIEKRGAAETSMAEKIAASQVNLQKMRVESTKRGMDAQIAMAQIETQARLDTLDREREQTQMIQSDYEKNRKIIVQEGSAAVHKIRTDAERQIADDVEKIQHDALMAQIQIDKRGLDAKLASITAAAEFEIRQQQKQLGQTELFEKKKTAILVKAEVDRQVAIAEARKAAQDQLRDSLGALEDASLGLMKQGVELELALIAQKTQRRIAAAEREITDVQLLETTKTNILIEATAERTQIQARSDANAKSIMEEVERIRISLTKAGLAEQQALELQRHRERVALLEKGGDATKKELDAELALHKANNDKILADYLKLTGNILKDAQNRGIALKSELQRDLFIESTFLENLKRSPDATPDAINQQQLRVLEIQGRLRGMAGIKTREELRLEAEEQRRRLDEMLRDRKQYTDQVIAQQRQIVKEVEKAARGEISIWRKVFDGVTDAVGRSAQRWAQFAQAVDGAMGKVAKAVATGMNAANIMLEDLDQLLSAKDAIGAIIAAVNMAIDAIGLMWDSLTQSPGESAMKEIYRDLGVEIGEELGNTIAETAEKEFDNSRQAAEIFHLKDIIEAAGGISDKNIDKLMARLRDVFVMYKEGVFTLEETRQVLDENFAAFADHVLKSGKVASAQFQELLAINQASGVKSEEILKFVANQTTRFGNAMTALMAPLRKNTTEVNDLTEEIKELTDARAKDGKLSKEQTEKLNELTKKLAAAKDKLSQNGEEIKRFERLTVAGFNAAIKNGVSFVDAIDQIGPALDTLNDANKALGRTATPALAVLLRFREVALANPELVQSAGALNEVALALSNIGGLGVEEMQDLQAQGLETFGKLKAAGFSENQALQQMKGFLETVRDAHERMGLPIDENTQKLIDQAEAEGVLAEKQQSTNDVLMEGLGEIIKLLGGDLPAAWKKMADEAATNAKRAQLALGGVAGAAGTIDDKLPDFDGWADDAVENAQRVEDAVDGVSFGHSPGGIKEIPIQLRLAGTAASEFATQMAAKMGFAKTAAESVKAPQLKPTVEPDKRELDHIEQLRAALAAIQESVAQAQDALKQAFAGTGVTSADKLTDAVDDGPRNAFDVLQEKLKNGDWESWADKIAQAAAVAQQAVDGVSFGHSPGGIKEIPLQFAKAMVASAHFSDEVRAQMEAAQAAVDHMRLNVTVPSPQMGRALANDTQAIESAMAVSQKAQQQKHAAPNESAGDKFYIDLNVQAIDAQSFRDAMKKPGGGVDIIVEDIWRNKRGRGTKVARKVDE